MIVFHHAAYSRSSAVLWLLEEIGAPYELVNRDIRAEGGVEESYRAIQPNKKVPAIEHDGAVVTERAAIALYLTERFPEAGLAPAPGDRNRAAFLTWLVYMDSVFDPCVSARAHGLEYESNDYSFGLFEDMVANVERQLSRNAFAVGDAFTAADVKVASSIHFTMNVLKVLPRKPVFEAYLERALDRPAYRRAEEVDAELAAVTPFFQNMTPPSGS